MDFFKSKSYLSLVFILFACIVGLTGQKYTPNEKILAYTIDPKRVDLDLYWKNDKGEILKNIQNLKSYVESKNKKLIFAMNGGMFTKDLSPVGLFIQNQKTLAQLDTSNGRGNFYLKPNGVFYLNNQNTPMICKTVDFQDSQEIKFATQSGPMLVINGDIHPAFKEGSTNLNIRNGVGVLPNNNLLFALSKTEINFYDFAVFFQKMGCKNALYLDGFVSKMYCPEKNCIQTDGNFGIIIGVTAKALTTKK
ncbi:MAG: phosphodiester glycosidase family protein [Leadbetterella sp.]